MESSQRSGCSGLTDPDLGTWAGRGSVSERMRRDSWIPFKALETLVNPSALQILHTKSEYVKSRELGERSFKVGWTLFHTGPIPDPPLPSIPDLWTIMAAKLSRRRRGRGGAGAARGSPHRCWVVRGGLGGIGDRCEASRRPQRSPGINLSKTSSFF